MSGNNVLVTGGAGFIGSNIVRRLLDENFDVKVIDNLSTGRKENLDPRCIFVKKDITNYNDIINEFEGIKAVFHVAALARILPSFEDPIFFHKVNVLGTLNVLKCSQDSNVQKVIYSASSSCYGLDFSLPTNESNSIQLINPYAIQKYEGELYCKFFAENFDMSCISLRYFNVYGPNSYNPDDKYNAYSSPVCIFLKQREQGKPLTITGDGNQKRDYVFVEDVARANVAALNADIKKFEAINIGSGKNYTVNEIAKQISDNVKYIPARPGEARVTLADISKAKRILKWEPRTTLIEGIRITEEMMKNGKN